MARWPSKSEEPLIHSTLRRNNKNVTSLRDNEMIVRVYFTSLTVQAFNEEESYTEENFVSDIGGQLGLWIGMSVLTLLGILIIIGLCKKLEREPAHVIPVNCKSSPLDMTIEYFSNSEKKA
ncbi:acid-sensing ion channel 4-like [Argopecten irradians]|uniref:acid-sensing ion channel 4-like n=1 Tax=Argopecten irradians TaxID=31199 RepID=UPI00370FA896